MIKKKKTARIFSVVITWIFLCASIFIPFLNLTGEKVFAESVDNSLYAFVSKQNKTAEGKIYVDFGIALDYILDDASPAGEVNRSDAEKMTEMRVAPFEYATIHLRTRNLSAIAEEGDYEPINQTVTVYGYNPYASIAVNINRDGLHVHRKELSYEDTLRSFYLEIYKVEIVGLKDGYELLSPNTTPNISAEKLTTEADMSIGSYQESVGDGYNLGLLYNVSHNGRIYYKTAVNEITENDSFYDIVFDLANFNNNWFNTIQYMSERNILKMGINIEGTGYEEENSWYVDNSLMGIQIFAGDSKKVGAPALEGVPDKNIFSDSTVSELARWYIKFQSDYEEDISLTNAYNGTFEGVTVNTSFNDGILLYGDLSNYNWGQGGRYDAFVEQGNSNIFIIDDLDATLNGSSVISTRIWSYLSNKKTKTCAPKVFFMPVNYRAEVVSATVGQAYYDEQGNVKMGVSLRFNEPMQLKQYSSGEELKPSIKGYLNKIVTNEVVFDYVAGDGTDTFYFETDLTELGYNMQLTSVTLNNANGFGEIYDFAPISYNVINGWQTLNLMIDENKVSGWDNVSGVNLPCSYDLRTPEIEMNGSVAQAVKTSHTTTIRTDYISETGTLYYGWAMDDQNIPQNLSSSPILAQGFQTISSPSGISGTRYLYAVAVSELGKQSEPMWIGPFHFDNEAPSLSIDCIKDTYKEKQFTINLSNNSIEGFNKFASLKESIRVVVSSDANGNNPIKELSIPLTEENQKAETVTIQNFTLTAEMLGLQEGYGTYYVTFSISDALENKGVSESFSYYFDVREIFDATLLKEDGDPNFEMDEFAVGGALSGTLGKNYYTLDLSKKVAGKDFYFKFETNDDAISALSVEEFKNVTTGVSVLSAIQGDSNQNVVKVSIKNKFAPGLYCLMLKDANSDKKSLPIYFYVTNGKDGERYQEETGGYQAISSNGVFTNKVFQIPTSVSYYYQTDTGEIKTQSYSQTNKPASFSSWATANEYVLYREYLDLYAVTLTQSLANDLNMGIYRKAEGSKQKAEVGQVWIRYKEVNWDPKSTTNEWVYYYYAADKSVLPINVNALSSELQIALNTVASKICACGKEVNLVTEEYLDKYGAPILVPEQMHLQAERSIVSMSGTAFKVAIEYLGDLGMYLSLDPNAPLSTNATLQTGEYRRLYYKTESSEYHLLTMDNRETFGEYLNATGKFTILELDENGVREYCIYVDKTAPTVSISWETQNGTLLKEFSKDDNGKTISGNNFYIESIADYDTLSFVAIYRYTSQSEGDLLSVYRKSDFDKGQGIRLEDGKYHVYVSDRSGNSYTFVLQMKSEPLACTIKEVDNSYIRFEVNRTEAEIRYQVYLDGVLLTTDFDDKRFTAGGQYRFLIEDIYGNIYDETYIFERDLPTVTWRYQTSDGSYVLYENDNERIKIQKIDEKNFAISTSAYLRFLPLDGCAYEIISGTPNPSENISSGWVALNNLTTFTIKVYYEMHPDTYVIYTCMVDNSAPQVSVTYEKGYYQLFEVEEIQKILSDGGFVLGDNLFTPTSIGFAPIADKTTTSYVANGQRVQSKYFKLQVSDESGVKEVKVYLDDVLILTEESDFSHIYLSRRGTYRIVATDKFSNTTTFSFTNDFEEYVEYFVDGEKISTDVSFAEYFDGTTYTKVEYGNTQTEIKLLSSVEVHYIITDAEDNSYYFAFVVEDGVMYTFQYIVKIVNGEYGLEIENVSSRGVKALASGEVAKIDDLGVAIYLTKNNDGTFSLSVRSTDSEKKTYTVETRVSVSENEMPYYFKTKLSTIPSTVEFVDGNGNSLNATQTIKVNNAFAVKDNITAEIQSVQVSYSQTGDYTTYKTVYDSTYYNYVFNKEGMYHVKVVNKYGIQTDYYVIISSRFVMSATVEYADGTKLNYSTTYEETAFYSNKSVEFIVYSTNVTVLDQHEAMSVTRTSQGYTAIYIAKSGEYFLKVQDEYGNVLEKRIFIAIDTLTLAENLLTGFNDKALRRDENYTNQKIFIDKNVMLGEGEIAFISMIYGDKTITIYDNVSEIYTAFDENQYVGIFGDGIYTLIFRDIYGNKEEKVIHYCETPTLTIVRNTLNGVGAEVYSLNEMIQNGVWTNDRVSFTISATEYILTVDGKVNVTSIAYDTKTKNVYEVYYLDEYGFEYTFKVYLHREEVVIVPTSSMSITQLSDLHVTKDNLKMEFTKNALCTYTLNDETEKVYNVGDVLYKDGIYRFKVVDKAGNVSTYTIKKDSAVEYRLEGSGSGEILVNGGITNGKSVKFFAENSDNAYIKKVFHNNEFIEYDDEIFTERGKWELIIADDAGNESYFRFYILYGKLDGFSYNTPYNYVITSVVWEMGDSIAEATETIKENGLRLEATENGTYTVTMQSAVTGDIKTFTFTIDKTPPQVKLVGCQQNEKTINNVTLTDCKAGDTIYVYKDGELIKTVRITSDYMDAPTISEAGKYKIVVENEAGIKTELVFERKYVPNVAGSVLIIVLALMSVAGLFVGLIWRNHSKTDD